MPKKRSTSKANTNDSKLLQRSARSPLMKTRTDKEPHYCLQNGEHVERREAERLINNGWVRGCNDSLFPGDSQTFVVLKP